ncbi:Aldehyde/histidinol dehydrogenase [Phaeosphaeriaceae sp. PMI808]|nr:Aldehyde/histidinol dehydrogenase [Phaeosphaeriaceae sp. PMI808]
MVIRTLSPVTGEVVHETPEATIEIARNVAIRAKEAFGIYRTTALVERLSVVTRAIEILKTKREDLGRELTTQMGRPIAYTAKEIDTMQIRAEYLIGTAADALNSIPGRSEEGFRRVVRKEPVGPVLIVFAWNFPYLILVNALIPALLAGNPVILKPSPQTPTVADRVQEAFKEAGLAPGVLQVLHSGDPSLLEEVAKLPEIAMISFTGSTKAGISLRKVTADRMIPLNLELGGNDPAYVRKDVDIKYVAAQLVDGAIFNSGQSCCSVERVYVHKDVHDILVAEMQEELKGYRMGDPFDPKTTVGPVVSQASMQLINSHVEDALSKGAIDVTPPNASFQKTYERGNYVSPRLLINADHTMLAMTEETFGPIIPVCKVSGDEDAISRMNHSQYGLTASVWTKNLEEGEKIIEQLEAGTVFINRCDYPNPDLAWTGWKMSGLGCSLGPRGFDAFFKLKSYHIKELQE